uniref:GST C-terminal domain-containing protein n=1 Tax=Ciona savignyi TaxID=51511 RepID=H2ZBA2_CIOSA
MLLCNAVRIGIHKSEILGKINLLSLNLCRINSSLKMSSKHQSASSDVDPKGAFVRKESSFRNEVKEGGEFPPENGRYHLYVSLACPWAHRTLIARKLKGLENAISYTVVDFLMLDNGWRFNENVEHCEKDPIFDAQYLREVYLKVSPGYNGRITVPVLFDKKLKKIVNNESSEIIRMFNKNFNKLCPDDEHRMLDFYPEHLQGKIQEVNDWIYPNINNGVYRCGFARSQEAYDQAVQGLFTHLDKVEDLLSKQRYLAGTQLTEADIRLFTTLVRFDHVYHGHFKCNKKRIIDYPNMWSYMKELYQMAAFGSTTDMNHITKHYQMSHTSINPFGIVYIGPDINFEEPHDRASKFPL